MNQDEHIDLLITPNNLLTQIKNEGLRSNLRSIHFIEILKLQRCFWVQLRSIHAIKKHIYSDALHCTSYIESEEVIGNWKTTG